MVGMAESWVLSLSLNAAPSGVMGVIGVILGFECNREHRLLLLPPDRFLQHCFVCLMFDSFGFDLLAFAIVFDFLVFDFLVFDYEVFDPVREG